MHQFLLAGVPQGATCGDLSAPRQSRGDGAPITSDDEYNPNHNWFKYTQSK